MENADKKHTQSLASDHAPAAGRDAASHDNVSKLGSLIKDIRVAMLTTVGDAGKFHSRPMATQEAEFDGTLWFFSGLSTVKTDELRRDPQVCVTYADPGANTYVSITGKAELVQDPAKIRELWSPALKAWFPKGVDDPEIVLIRVDAERADYWDSPSSKVVQLVGFLKAVTTGERYRGGEHGSVNL